MNKIIFCSLSLLALSACKKDPTDPEKCEDFAMFSGVGPITETIGPRRKEATFISNTEFVFLQGSINNMRIYKGSLLNQDTQFLWNNQGPELSSDGKFIISRTLSYELASGNIQNLSLGLSAIDQLRYSRSGNYISGVLYHSNQNKTLAFFTPQGVLTDSISINNYNINPTLISGNSHGIIAAESWNGNKLGLLILNRNDKSYYTTASAPYTNGKQQFRSLCWHPDERRVFYSTGYGIFVYDSKSKELIHLKNGCQSKEYLNIDISADGRKLLSTVVIRSQPVPGRINEEYQLYLLDLNTMVESIVY